MDEKLYSRQLYVLGRDAQERLQQARVLLVGGMNGLAAEIAKNLVLAGVNALTLEEDGSVSKAKDLASQFFLSEDDVAQGVTRCAATVKKLGELNAYVSLNTLSSAELQTKGLGGFTVVIAVNPSRQRLSDLGKHCREHGVALCATASYGLYGYIFNDFGSEFTVIDKDGEAVKQGIVVGVEPMQNENGQEKRLLVTTADDLRHGLEDGDWVRFSGLEGMPSLCSGEPREVKSVEVPDSQGKLSKGLAFSVTASEDSETYQGGGHFEQVKQPLVAKFAPFEQAVESPVFVENDWLDTEKPSRLHAFLQGLWAFQDQQDGNLPKPFDDNDAGMVIELLRAQSFAKDQNVVLDESKVAELRALARHAAGELNPMAAYLGGIAAQEVLKACSGKFTPIQQWLHFASAECLATLESTSQGPATSSLDERETPGQLRYEGQTSVFGYEFQKKLAALKVFVVGAGALGCETLKNLALMGVGCKHSGGEIIVTDMDAIETSNLNRQFLFRPHHVGQMKSSVAAQRCREMNPAINIRALEIKVAPDTEATFNDEFWSGLDLVINCLDNVVARKYVDSKCLFHQKPLLESGTLGTKANTLPVVPFLTESYNSDPVQDDGGQEIPTCTLHAYPNLIEHTLAWARDAVFERLFNLDAAEALELLKHLKEDSLEDYVQELERQPSTMVQRLKAARGLLVGPQPNDHPEKLFPYSLDLRSVGVTECVELARMHFEELFVNKIELLLHVHPENKTVDENGTRFWSGKRRAPSKETLDVNDSLHLQFLSSALLLFANVFGLTNSKLKTKSSRERCVREVLSELPPLPVFQVDDSVQIPENDEEAKKLQKQQEDQAKADALDAAQLLALELDLVKKDTEALHTTNFHPQQFEKDDDSNGHMDFIFAAASIRARAYGIPLIDQLEAKRIVGRIIPAIATTTAMTTGAVALELYKVLHGHPIDKFRASNVNLAVNWFTGFEPTPCSSVPFGKPKYVKAGNKTKTCAVSIWTMEDLKGDLTVQQVLDHFDEKFEFEVNTISTKGDLTLYNDMFGQEERLEEPLSAIYRRIVGEEPPKFIILDIDGDFLEDESEDDDDESFDGDMEEEEEEILPPPCRLEWGAV